VVSATKYYLSPSGNDTSGSGVIGSPWFTLEKAWTVVAAGDTIYLRAGTYSMTTQQDLDSKNGTNTNYIKIWNYPNETPIITRDLANAYIGNAINLTNSSYIYVKGIEIWGYVEIDTDSWPFGFYCNNVSYSKFELLNIHHNSFGMAFLGAGNNNYILNCDFHHNSDPNSNTPPNMLPWGGADGLTIRTSGFGNNLIEGCRMYWNSDDGFDGFDAEGNFTFKNCWIFLNGYRPGLTPSDADSLVAGGDGNGLKMGPLKDSASKPDSIKRTIYNCVSFDNTAHSFNQNISDCRFLFYNNISYSNGGTAFSMFWSDYASHIFRNNISYQDDRMINTNSVSTADHNNFNYNNFVNSSYSVSDADFLSVSSVGVDGARQANGNLPSLNFLKLVVGSDLIDTGIDVGIDYLGTAPDLGAYEHGIEVPPAVPSGGNLKHGGKIVKYNGKIIKGR
jgi:hypothetical protein